MKAVYKAQDSVEQAEGLGNQDPANIVIFHPFSALVITGRLGSGILYLVKFKLLEKAPAVQDKALNLCIPICLTSSMPVPLEAQGIWCPLVVLHPQGALIEAIGRVLSWDNPAVQMDLQQVFQALSVEALLEEVEQIRGELWENTLQAHQEFMAVVDQFYNK